ncbi:Y-box-binding protein 2-like [Portunus trituberculatus]|uniref:Y-box-binding protein 3 n=1 Tax=Portunus trituberculatus TaxID=210409 RepID=A0A5B7CUI2_PORTR|nr:Y-box-binding protein 2-like [Portunus trituberculatus]MPC11966.1 Y-box-binding protein 3 [Portunus trituberculatus]
MAPARSSNDDETTSLADHLPGRVKWYNIKAGYGFIENQQTREDVFIHVSGLTRSLKKDPPKESDEVVFNIYYGEKGPEARHVVKKNTSHTPLHPTARCTRNTAEAPELLEAKILACVFTAKAIAGADHRHLQSLIPLLLKHNGLPAIHVPLLALAPPRRQTQTLQRRSHPENIGTSARVEEAGEVEEEKDDGQSDNSTTERGKHAETAPKEEKHRAKEEACVDVTDEDGDEEEDDEDEEVDVLGSGSEETAPSPQATKQNRPSDPQPPSGKQDDGWVTKEKRRRRSHDDPYVLPKDRRTTTPSVALRESPTIARLRQENRSGRVEEDLLTGAYIHDGDRFVGFIKGYSKAGYMNYPYPKGSDQPVKRS